MGLASSQARLLSLTSRQHAIEGTAQRLLSEKLRLSNQSDDAYQKYMNVLDETTLKTLFVNNVGEKSWIAGNINNLMRLNAPDDTSGTPFFVQDLTSGKLYVPQDIADSYDDYLNLSASTIPVGHEYTEAMKFATIFGVKYEKIDLNEDILKAYNNALANDWDKALTDNQFETYLRQQTKDKEINNKSSVLLNIVNCKDSEKGYYDVDDSKNTIGEYFERNAKELLDLETVQELLKGQQIVGNDYNTNVALINKAIEITSSVKASKVPESITKTTSGTSNSQNGGEGARNFTYTQSYKTTEILAIVGEKEYIKYKDGTDEFTGSDKFEIMLNGGQTITKGTTTIEYTYPTTGYTVDPVPCTDKPIDDIIVDIYDSETTTLISKYEGAENLGDALKELFRTLSVTDGLAKGYLESIGKTENDVATYHKYKAIKSNYDSYKPVYEYRPTNRVQATYYENLFKIISAAGGCIGVNDTTANNETWVNNMIKNASVILTTWDNDTESLSKTSAALHTDVQEVADKRKIEQAEQEYDAIMTFINSKDLNFDNRLTQLETERSAIKTEVDAIKKVMDDNVKTYFKAFS